MSTLEKLGIDPYIASQAISSPCTKKGYDKMSYPLQAIPINESFLAAMQSRIPASAGIAIGVDRLLKNPKQIISFTWEVA